MPRESTTAPAYAVKLHELPNLAHHHEENMLSTVFVPAGALHAPRILRGTGTVLSIIRAGDQATMS